MIKDHPLFVSVLCRHFNYSYMDFMSLLAKSRRDILQQVAEREELSRLQIDENYKTVCEKIISVDKYNVLHPAHEAYPERWHSIHKAPVFVCSQGSLELLKKPMITVVGSRRTLLDFTDWMDTHYVQFLKNNDVVTVSGGAYGIDSYATKLALFSGRSSILILPSGFSRAYPTHVGHWLLNKNVLSMSEYFPHESVRNYHFVHRNRLLGAISANVFVVQCAVKSGSMTTVKYALDAGGDVLTLPSFPSAIESSGNIQLIKEGAQVIAHAKDLELCMGMFTPHPKSEN